MSHTEFTATSLEDYIKIATDALVLFGNIKIWAFHGDLGAGKTTFIKALSSTLGYEDEVTSPTFSLVNHYEYETNKQIYHMDLYRVKDYDEAFDFGIEEYLYSGNYCFIEWPNVIEDYIEEAFLNIQIERLENGNRKLKFIEISS